MMRQIGAIVVRVTMMRQIRAIVVRVTMLRLNGARPHGKPLHVQ